MKSGVVIAVAAVVLYAGFEAYAVRKVSHRMEPTYLHTTLQEARAATESCQHEHLALRERFEETLVRISALYRDDLVEQDVGRALASIERQLTEESNAAGARISALKAEQGCELQAMKDHFQRYRIHAKRS